jgi:hypothetical protein
MPRGHEVLGRVRPLSVAASGWRAKSQHRNRSKTRGLLGSEGAVGFHAPDDLVDFPRCR